MMQKFSVGQKVKIIDAKWFPSLVGQITTILHYDSKDDGYEIDIKNPISNRSQNLWAHKENLVPINDGSVKSSWSECAWKPNPKLIEYHDKTTKTEKM
jgi:hypothetical protein